MKTIWLLSISCLIRVALTAEPALDTNRFQMVLKGATAFELPAAAALLVRQAPPEDRAATATNVVRLALRINPAATLAIVDQVSRTDASVAAVITEAAAREQPTLVVDITRCASAAAPGHAAEIVARAGRIVPEDLTDLAAAAAEAAPAASLDILRAAAGVRPELKPYIDEEIARSLPRAPSVAGCLARAEQFRLRTAPGDLARKANGPPLSRPSAPGQHGDKPPRGRGDPPGGRNYAKP